MNYTIETKCPECKKTTDIVVTEEGFRKRQAGALVQVAFPELSPPMREMLITGICPDCWVKMFSIMDSEQDDECKRC